MRGYGQAYADGKLTAVQFEGKMRAELKSMVVSGYRFGKGAALEEQDVQKINHILSMQHEYLGKFIGDVRNAPDDDALGWVANRASLYSSAAIQADAAGTIAGTDDNEMLTWNASDDQGTCDTCGDMSGTTMSAADWDGNDVTPGVGVDCGPNCRCSLEPAA